MITNTVMTKRVIIIFTIKLIQKRIISIYEKIKKITKCNIYSFERIFINEYKFLHFLHLGVSDLQYFLQIIIS